MFPDPPDGGETDPEPQACPLCGQVKCSRGVDPGPEPPRLLVVTKSGAPRRVFQRITDSFHDAGRELIGKLIITCEGVPDMQSLGVAVPQCPKGEYRLVHEMTAEFGKAGTEASLSVRFDGA